MAFRPVPAASFRAFRASYEVIPSTGPPPTTGRPGRAGRPGPSPAARGGRPGPSQRPGAESGAGAEPTTGSYLIGIVSSLTAPLSLRISSVPLSWVTTRLRAIDRPRLLVRPISNPSGHPTPLSWTRTTI